VKIRLLISVVCVPALVPAGYLSNLVTRRICERRAAQEVVRGIQVPGMGRSTTVYVLSESPAESAHLLEAVGLRVQPCRTKGAGFRCFPWGEVARARTVAPYVMSIKWGFVAAPLAGRGGETQYVCFFGFAIPISERGLWVT
jgi:hypothetical protein